MGDHPLLPSGVGTQSRYVFEALLDTGKFEILSLGGAIKHPSYEPQRTEKYQDSWTIMPVNGYGDAQTLRGHVLSFKPDIIWFMTDPRFYEWLWGMEDELRENCSLVYYHVWDNYPYPTFNKTYYNSNDAIATISKVTSDIVKTVAPDVHEKYIPHAVDPNVFNNDKNQQQEKSIKEIKEAHNLDKKFVFFWNNRNARRKQSGSLVFWWKEFLDIVGHDKATLIMHTEPYDPHGQPIPTLMDNLGLTQEQLFISVQKVPPEHMALFYKMSDCTINISDAEGFGLATLESLACGTPIIVNMTGGLQEQVTDGEEYFGIGIEPSSKAVIGSNQCPWICEDRISKQDFLDACLKMYNMSQEERDVLGEKGRQHVLKNYNFETFQKQWVDFMTGIYENNGSWEKRKFDNNRWELIEV
jgi:glycosyltransferase involved in cell wall biosynthesis|tara:strand:+ start:131 stop:1369 length:1239 start_codon:yes stop_codon:yes gene_type:complete